jgi:hypothetical protein
MFRPETGNRRAGGVPVAVITPPPAQLAEASQPGRRPRILAALAGITGPVLLAAYFLIPALIGWPSAGESAGRLTAYADAHRLLFYLGGWLQGTGALLSVGFILVLLQHSGARRTMAGSATLVGCAVLLSVVAVEAVLLEAVPVAAANGDHATVATAFALTNGVFVRIYPLAPAPLVFAGIGFALWKTTILPRVFGWTAVLISALFLVAGLAAVFGTAGLILATVMSAVEAIWIPATAIAFARAATPARLVARRPATGLASVQGGPDQEA